MAIISDSHGKKKGIALASGIISDADVIIHLGDNHSDCTFLKLEKNQMLISVKGNCDLGDLPLETFETIGGKRFLITHGHKYHVKFGLDRLYLRALELQADAVLFGHTHIPLIDHYGGILFLNPGSVSEPRGSSKPTAGIIQVTEEINANIVSLNDQNSID